MKNQIFKGLLVAIALPFALVGNSSEAMALSVSSSVSGSSNLTPVFGSSFQNGDFNITANPGNPTFTRLGDGLDEFTRWEFEFANDSNWGAFKTAFDGGNAITSALLTMTLRPNGVSTDSFGSSGIGGVSMPGLVNAGIVNDNRSLQTFTIDLLDPNLVSNNISSFSDARIRTNFDTSTGKLAFAYQDDATISFAQLELTTDTQTVPEPTTILGSLGVLGAGAILRRKKQQNGNLIG